MSVPLWYDTTELKDIMTIAELIKELEQYPQDTRVVISGYEGGVNDVNDSELIKIYLNCNSSTFFYGKHEEVSSLNTCIEGKYEKVPAVHLI